MISCQEDCMHLIALQLAIAIHLASSKVVRVTGIASQRLAILRNKSWSIEEVLQH